MSGIEIAGLVLGAFPIVIEVLESYRSAFASLKNWWEFQRTFEDFIDDVGIQRAHYDNNLEKLLAPFVDSDAQMGVLLSDPFGPSWRSTDLEQKLQDRLGPSFPFYKSLVGRMNEVLVDLQRLLGLENGQAMSLWANRSLEKSEIKREFKRLRISFSKKRVHHVDTLSKRNDDLAKLLQSSDELAPMRRQRRTTSSTVLLKQLQSYACSLYDVLDSAWGCSCQSSHTAHLCLERRIDQGSIGAENWRIHLPKSSDGAHKTSFEEVEVLIKDDGNGHGPAINSTSTSSAGNTNLMGQFKDEVTRQLSLVSISGSGASKTGSHVRLSACSKPDNQNFLTVSPTPSLQPRPRSPYRRVAFADPTPNTETIIRSTIDQLSISSNPIPDICSALKSLDPNTKCLGFLEDSQNRRHLFCPSQKNVLEDPITLHDALKPELCQNSVKALNRQDRFTIAVTLASSLLQLHNTPWLTDRWSKSDVILPADTSQQKVMARPLLRAKFHSGGSSVSSQQNTLTNGKFNTKKALSSLGIMLLELCFGKKIEDHPLRPQFFGPNNQPNAFTDISTAKEWHEDVLGELGDDMSDAIRRCLDCSFAPKPHIEDKEFQEAVLDGVIIPLQEVLKVWEKT